MAYYLYIHAKLKNAGSNKEVSIVSITNKILTYF